MLEQDFKPGEIAALEAILAKQSRNILSNPSQGLYIVSEVAMEASRTFGKNPLIAMQKLFDKHQFPVKFVAIPIESDLKRTGIVRLNTGGQLSSDVSNYDIRMPHSGDQSYPNWLWTTIGRPDEYYDLLAQLESSPEENLDRLAQTGFLCIREGTDISKAAHALDN